MPRAFLKTKNRGGHHTYKCTVCGKSIEPGDDYYTWKFNRGGRYWQHASHGPPKRSQLSQSKMGEVWDAVEAFDVSEATDPADIKAALESVAEAARSVAEQYSEAAQNILSAFPSGNSTSESCQGTADELEAWASNLDSWESDADDEEGTRDPEEWLEEVRNSAQELVDEQPEYQG